MTTAHLDRFANKIALVTGAASGLGRATAIRLAEEGAAVACLDLAEDRAAETAHAITRSGGRAVAFGVDVSRPELVEAAVGGTVAEFGRIDVAVNAAGIIFRIPALELPTDLWDLTLDVNLKGTFLVATAAAREMAKAGGGSIVNVTSIGALKGGPTRAAYAASKAGVKALTDVLAVELAPLGIRVNAVAPGPIETPMTEQVTRGGTPEASGIEMPPAGRWGRPDEVASAICYLASADASFCTGTHLVVDGGQIVAPM